MFTVIMSLISSVAMAAVNVGDSAPSFELKGHDGKTYSLESEKGNFVVLEWFNNECPYVEKHYDAKKRNMQTLQEKWIAKAKAEGKSLTWFAMASSAPGKQGHLTAETATKIRNKERRAKMTAILLDSDGKVGKAYGAQTTPHMYVISPKGKLMYMGAIDDKPSARVASLDGAKNYVSEALTSLFAGRSVAEASTKPYGCSVKY